MEQFKETRKVTFGDARQSLSCDHKDRLPEPQLKLPPPADVAEAFEKAATDQTIVGPPNRPEISRAEQIKREMED